MKKKIFIASAIVIGLLIFFAGLQNRTVHLPFSDEEVSYSDMWEKKQYSKIIEYGSTVLEKNPMDRNTLIFTGYAYFYQGISILDMDERNSCMEKAVVLLRQALLTDGKENADVMFNSALNIEFAVLAATARISMSISVLHIPSWICRIMQWKILKNPWISTPLMSLSLLWLRNI